MYTPFAKDKTLLIFLYFVSFASPNIFFISFLVSPSAPSNNKFNPYFIDRGE